MKTLSRYVSSRVARGGSPPTFAANVIYKATADIVSKGVTLMVTVAAARALPAADFGVLALAMTTGWILSVASDAGLPLFLAKRVAGMTGAALPPSFGAIASVMRVRATFGAVAALAGLTIGSIVAPSSLLVAFVLIVTAQLLNAILETLSHAYRGMGRADVESRVVVAQRGVTGAAALATLLLWPSLPALAVALAMPPAIALVASLAIARSLTIAYEADFAGLKPRATDRPCGAALQPRDHRGADVSLNRRRFMREAAPIGAGILLSALYFRCDVYFLHWWYGLETVGTYNAAFRIVEALRLFPAAVLAVAFPALCGAGDGRPLKRLILLLGAGGAAAAAAVYVSAPIVLTVLYGPRFGDAVAALRILALALPLFFVNYALTHQVIAWDGQRSYLAIAAIALIASLVANTMLIPMSGMAGAAASTLLTEVTVAAGCAVALRRTARNPSLAGSVA